MIANDWQRGVQAIRDLRLRSTHEGVGFYRIPKDRVDRSELVDVVYDLTDEWAARAIADGPSVVVEWD